MKIVLTVLVCIVLACAGALGFIYSGIFDVAAAHPDNPLLAWALSKTSNRSIISRLGSIEVPATLDHPELIQAGAKLFGTRCVVCHGGPGLPAGEIAQGLNPAPPNLFSATRQPNAGRYFWFIKNGVKMTAMPAFGKTHSDDDIWALVAFLRTAPGMSPQDFATKTGRPLPPAAAKPAGG